MSIGEQVVELHKQGVRSIDIAHRLNVAQSTVHYHLRKLAERPTLELGTTKPLRRGPGRGARTIVRTQEQVAELLKSGITRADVARHLGITKSTVSYHARRLGQPIDDRCRRRYDWAAVQAFYAEGNSVRDCCREFGFSSATWHSAVQRGVVTPRPGFRPVEEVFAANTWRNRGHLKQRLLRLGLKESRCERCELRYWGGVPLSMELHHLNGDRTDNRLANLQLLCPNCHSQTDSYSGRSGHRRPAPTTGLESGAARPTRPDAALALAASQRPRTDTTGAVTWAVDHPNSQPLIRATR